MPEIFEFKVTYPLKVFGWVHQSRRVGSDVVRFVPNIDMDAKCCFDFQEGRNLAGF